MDLETSFAISAAGMDAERTRAEIAALNLANANTVQTAEGLHYQPLRAVAHSVPPGASFVDAFDRAGEAAQPPSLAGIGLPQVDIVPAGGGPRVVYEPGHPLADAHGFVRYAGVDTATEMISLMSAMRSYEANVAAMNMARTLALRALDIGGTTS